MEPVDQIKGVAAPIRLANVNTDQIFPARFIKKPRAVNYAQFAFHDIRQIKDGVPDPDFPLNMQRYKDARILVAAENFGCGSSREGAVYTLQDSGVRAVIAPSFGDIFAANCLKNGVLTIMLEAAAIVRLQDALDRSNTAEIHIDLHQELIVVPGDEDIRFSADPFQKHCLLNGLNEIDLSLEHLADIEAFEAHLGEQLPWLDGAVHVEPVLDKGGSKDGGLDGDDAERGT